MPRTLLCLKLFVRRAWRSIYTCTAGMFSRTLYAWDPVSLRNIPSPPALANDVWSRCKFSTLTSTPLYSSRLCAENPGFEIVQESVKVCTTEMSSRTLYAQHPVSLRIFHLSPVLAYVFLSPGKSSTVQCTVFYTLHPNIIPRPLSHGRIFDTGIRSCWIPNTPLRKGTYGTFLMGQSAPFFIHPSPNWYSIQIRAR